MKRKPLSGVLGLFILFGLLAGSCTKTAVNEQNMQPQSASSVTEAKSWLTRQSTLNSNAVSKTVTQTSILNPDWEHATAKDDENYQTLEIPVTFGSKVFLATTTDNAASATKNITKYLILKDKKTGALSSVLMTAISEKNIDEGGLHYSQVPAGFSGKVLYTNAETAALITGWEYSNGKITGTISAGKHIEAANPNCQDIIIGTYATTCYYNMANVLQYCDDPILIGTTTITSCTGGGGGGGAGSSTPQTSCEADAYSFLYAGASMSGPETMTTEYNTGSEWKVVYNWKIFSAGTWGLVSYEKATLHRVYYPDNISRWEYLSFEHDKILPIGINIGGTRTFTDEGAIINTTPTNQTKWVRIDFTTTSTVAGCPIVGSLPQAWNANKTFYAPN